MTDEHGNTRTSDHPQDSVLPHRPQDGAMRSHGNVPVARPEGAGGGTEERMAEQSLRLVNQARQLDSRLRSVSQTDRQLTRRAAGHVTQLARRLSVLLSRTSSVLPMLPTAGGSQTRRINHYVLHAERLPSRESTQGRVRMLTVGTNGMLRTGSTERDSGAILWSEYDPFSPAEGWPLESVMERLSAALGSVETHVESVEARVQERSRGLNALMAASQRGAKPASPTPVQANPVAPLLSLSHAVVHEPPAANEMLADAMRDLEADEIFPEIATTERSTFAPPVATAPVASPPVASAPVVPVPAEEPALTPLEDARRRYERSKHKRQMFEHLR